MNIFKKFYCRAYQTVFRILLPVLPYREPKILGGMGDVADLLKKEGKKKAYEAYKRAIKQGVTNKEIQAGIVNYLKQIKIQGTDKKYIKQGSTWFNGNCWDDEYSVGSNNSPVNQKQSTAYAAADERKDRAEGFMRNLKEHPEWFTQDHIKAFLKDFPEMESEVKKIERAGRTSDSDTAK